MDIKHQGHSEEDHNQDLIQDLSGPEWREGGMKVPHLEKTKLITYIICLEY